MNQAGGSQQAPVSAAQPGQSRARFNKRKGTSGIEGQFYEINLLTSFLFHAGKQKKDGQIEGFYLASNVDEAGALDDLVYRIDSKDQTGNIKSTIHFLQAKHRVTPRNEICLQDSFLKSKKGDFSLDKYFTAYKDIKQKYSVNNNDPIFMRDFQDCHFIIYTNEKFKIGAETEFLKIKNEDGSVWNLNVDNYFYQINYVGNEGKIKKALKYVTDCRKLARELAKCVSACSIISEKTPIFDKYREPLLQKVFVNNKLQKGFLEGHANLSPGDREFREEFFEEIEILKDFKNKDREQIKREISNRNLNISPTFVPPASNSNTSINSLPSDTLMQVEIEEFLKKLKLFIGQPSESELKDIIVNKLKATFSEKDSEEIFKDVQNEVKEWWESDTFYLTDEDKYFERAQQNISEKKCSALFDSYITSIQELDLSFIGTKLNNSQEDLNDLINNKRIINIVTDTKTMSLVKAKVYQALETIDEYKSQKYIFLGLSDTLRSQDRIIDTFKTVGYNLLAIHCDGKKKDTVEELFNQLINIITDYDTKKIIIIAQKTNQLAEKFKTFSGNNYVEIVCKNNNLTDLTQESWENIFEKQVIFQGNEICIDKLISYNTRNLIGAEDLSDLINDVKVKIGKTPLDLGDVGNYYINRVFKYNNTISDKCFTDDTNECFALSNIAKDELQRLVSRARKGMFTDNDRSRFFILNELCEFEQLSRNEVYANKIIHWLKKDGAKFKWLKSHGSVGNLRKYLDTSSVEEIQENDIFSLSDRIIIVSGEPGMGKSIVLTKLLHLKHSDELCWTISINLNDNTKSLDAIKFDNIEEDAISFLSEASELKTPLEKELFIDKLAAQDQMVLFIDGYDEISPTYADKVIKLLRYLQDTKAVKIVITTRPNMTVKLEDELSLFSCSLKPLNKKDQIKFLQKFWTKNINYDPNNNRSKCYIKGLLKYWSQSIVDTEVQFTGIPLQTRMIADIFQEDFKKFYDSNAEKPNFSNNLDIFNIYQLFTNKKFLIFCEEKMKENSTIVSIQNVRAIHKKNFESNHMLLALSTLLPDEEVNKLLSIKEANLLEELKQNVNKGAEKTGIVFQMDMDNNKPIFVHRTFAEYYAAYWFGDNKDEEYAKQYLCKHLFEEDFKVVRHFFDRFLCIKKEVIIATLNNDTHTLENLLTQKPKEVICECDKEGRSALHLASAYGYLDIVTILLKLKKNINITDDVSDKLFKWRPLTYAIKNTHWNVVELLLQEGARSDDLVQGLNNPKEQYGYENDTLLHIAARQGYTKLAETLVNEYGNIVNTCNKRELTPLHLAASRGHLEILSVLLNHHADVNACDNNGQTPLHHSARSGELEVTKCLVQHKADVNACDKKGRTPLHLSAFYGKLEVTKYLVQQKADVNARDENGTSPLHLSAGEGRLDTVKFLLENGASMSVNKYGDTVLRRAVRGGSLEVVQYLVEQGNADVNERDVYGMSPLHMSARAGHLDIVKFLLERGASMSVNKYGETVLRRAVDGGKLEVVQYLVEQGYADVNERYKWGESPLHISAREGQLDIVKFLLERGASMSVNKYGATVLTSAVEGGSLEVVQYLVEQGYADVNERDEWGQSPLRISAWRGHLDIVKILLENGASRSVDMYGDTVLRCAVLSGSLEVVQYLVEQGYADVNEIYK